MDEASLTPQEKARKAHSIVLQRLQDPGTARSVAIAQGVSESTVSRTKATLEDAIALLYQLGFKVVPQEMRCYPADYVQALRTMARLHMQEDKEPLQWD